MRLAIFTLLCAGLAGISCAFEQSAPGDPSGNPIHTPDGTFNVPVGKKFIISWQPTSPGPVTLLLLKGPSTNVIPIATIASGIHNTGSFEWTPSTDLQASDKKGYGIKLIDDKTKAYQYSVQFGISNPNPSKATTSHTSTKLSTSTKLVSQISDGQPQIPVATPSISLAAVISGNSTIIYTVPRSNQTIHVASTGSKPHSIIKPTITMSVPTSLRTPGSPKPPSTTGLSAGPATSTPSPSNTTDSAPASTSSSAAVAGAIAGNAGSMLVGLGAIFALLM
ncbi:hypothetical protein MMC09_002478 [Bachmanniomyces sp. S44760]|nr:hypothetical protein [Bachmanniomyces sp. S44760]